MPQRSQTQRRKTLSIRVKPDELELIDRAARARGQSRTDFILAAARQAAEDALVDRRRITMSPEGFREFVKLLDAKPRPVAELRKTMQVVPPWEKE